MVFVPSGSAPAWRKTSSPSSPEMKPKPFSASYPLTLPVGTVHLLLATVRWTHGSARPSKVNPCFPADPNARKPLVDAASRRARWCLVTSLPRDVPAHEIGSGFGGFWRALPREGRFLLSTVALQHLGRGMTLPFTVIYLHEVRHFSLDTAGTVMALLALVAAVMAGPM